MRISILVYIYKQTLARPELYKKKNKKNFNLIYDDFKY